MGLGIHPIYTSFLVQLDHSRCWLVDVASTDLRDEGARLETTTHIVDGSSLGIQDHNGDMAIDSAGDEGNHNGNVNLTASSVALDLWEEEDQVRSKDRSQPKEKDCPIDDLMDI